MNELEELKAKVESLETAKSALEAQVAELVEANKKVEELTTQLEAAQNELAAAKKELDAIAAAKAHAARVNKLAEAGLETDEVEEAVKKFASLNDEQFDEMVKLLSMTYKKYAEKKKAEKDDEEEDKTKSSEEVDESAEASLSPAPGASETLKGTGLVDAVASLLNHKKKNKNGDK